MVLSDTCWMASCCYMAKHGLLIRHVSLISQWCHTIGVSQWIDLTILPVDAASHGDLSRLTMGIFAGSLRQCIHRLLYLHGCLRIL